MEESLELYKEGLEPWEVNEKDIYTEEFNRLPFFKAKTILDEYKRPCFEVKYQDGTIENKYVIRVPNKIGTNYLPKHREWDEICLRDDVQQALLNRKRRDATELLCSAFIQDNKILTTRDDKDARMWIKKNNIYVPEAKTYIQEFVRRILKNSYTVQMVNEVIEKIKADTFISNDEFFKSHPEKLIPCLNGVYDLSKDNVISYDDLEKEYYFKSKYNVNCKEQDVQDVEYMMDAYFDTKGINDRLTLQEVVGCCFYNDLPVHNFSILYGGGRNGKGTILRVIEKISNGFTSGVALSKFKDNDDGQNFYLADLLNKTANIAGDIDGGVFPWSACLKSITGKDAISAKIKGIQQPINFIPVAQHIFSCNDLPIFKDNSLGFWERLNLIKFTKKTFISKEDYNICKEQGDDMSKFAIKKSEEEFGTQEFLDSFFWWGIIGLKRLLRNNRFSNHKKAEEKRKTYLMTQNPVMLFIPQYFEESFDDYVDASVFNHHLKGFIQEMINKTGNASLKKNLNAKIKAALEESNLYKEKKENIWKIAGIKLKNIN